MLDLNIYNSNITAQKRFYLLYGIYAVSFLGLCFIMPNVNITIPLLIKGLAVIALFTLWIALKIKSPVKSQAVTYY